MRSQARPERLVFAIRYAKIPAGFGDQLRDGWIIRMTNAGEQVVLDLKIEAPHQPCHEPAAPGKVHGCFGLVERPTLLDTARLLVGKRKLGLFDAVRQLKYDAQ